MEKQNINNLKKTTCADEKISFKKVVEQDIIMSDD